MRRLFLFLCLSLTAAAQSDLVKTGFQYFYNLQYDQAIATFSRLVAEKPNDPECHNHLAQAILYRDMFRAGALETQMVTGANPFLRRAKVDASPEDQRRFDDAINRAMDLAQARLKEDPKDIPSLYALGVSYGLRANYNFLVRKAWLDSLRDASTARKWHAKATDIDPGFVDARLIQGVYSYVVGSLPFHWKLLGFVIGFRGNKQAGIRMLEQVARDGKDNRVDAQLLLCAIYRRERQPERAIPLLEELIPRFPRNFLLPMELAQMYADAGDKTKALASLNRLEARKRADAPGYARLPIEKIRFAEGTIQFWYNDLDQALENMKAAAAATGELDLNTGVMAWMRLGQIYDLKGQREAAIQAYRRACSLAPDSEIAKESRQYMSSPYRRGRRG
jgi:tetratricopeptide (TPR) repeat protein